MVTTAGGAPITATGDAAAIVRSRFLAQLPNFSVLRFSGDDASEFLHGQLTCDVKSLQETGRSSYGAYCSAKGRILASFLLWQHGGDWFMALPGELAPSIQKRLGMFVLRAKVRITLLDDTLLTGIHAPEGLSLLPVKSSDIDHTFVYWADGVALTLPGKRWLVACSTARTQTLWTQTDAQWPRANSWAWELQDILLGIPWISAATQEQFVPQMVNLELIGGVSFKKGCYPGQEIVARTQYLGKVKRRMFLARCASPVSAGMPVCSENVDGQVNGMVVNALPDGNGGSFLLASVQVDSATNSRVHVSAPDGPILEFGSLPYDLS